MAKKIISVCIVLAAIIAVFANQDKLSLHAQVERYYDDIAADAGSVLLYDLDSEETVYSKNTDKQINVGSITKLLSLIVAAPYFNKDELIHVGAEVDFNVAEDASRSMIRKGQTLTYYQLLTAILLPSGCDATMTLAVNAAKRMSRINDLANRDYIQIFCNAMNDKAAMLGCENSFFVNPDGQDDEKQYTCLNDVFLIVREAMKDPLISEISDKCYAEEELVSGEKYQWVNTNKMINPDDSQYYEYAHGIKTGSTIAGGYCLVSRAEKNGHNILAIVCGCPAGNARYNITTNLYKLCFIDHEYG